MPSAAPRTDARRSSTASATPRRRLTTWIIVAAITTGIVLGAFSLTALWRAGTAPALDGTAISWPSTGAAAVMVGTEVASSADDTKPRPMASIAKLVTALVVLDSIPLEPGDSGPQFVLTAADAERAQADRDSGGASIPITPGETLSARQLLEHMIVASSNGHTLALVERIFGSEAAFLVTAQGWLTEHDLTGIEIADATGLSPASRATAHDLLMIGRLAADQPVLAQIARMPGFLTREGFQVRGTNDLLGTLGVDGLKTGHTDEAGYTILFSTSASAERERLIGVVLGSPNSAQRATDVTRLIASVRGLME